LCKLLISGLDGVLARHNGFSSKSQIQLERKEDMKARGCASPDMGDVLAMTFAVNVRARVKTPPPKLVYTFPDSMPLRWMG
jgi:hypothetical protein